MFDLNHFSGSRLDLSFDDLFNAVVSLAQSRLNESQEVAFGADVSAISGDYTDATYIADRARDILNQSRWIALPIRIAVEERTDREAGAARVAVRLGRATWMIPACYADTCGDCDYPLAWHIVVSKLSVKDGMVVSTERILCPLGREFWAHARAIMERVVEATHVTRSAYLREIAQGTARGATANSAALA